MVFCGRYHRCVSAKWFVASEWTCVVICLFGAGHLCGSQARGRRTRATCDEEECALLLVKFRQITVVRLDSGFAETCQMEDVIAKAVCTIRG